MSGKNVSRQQGLSPNRGATGPVGLSRSSATLADQYRKFFGATIVAVLILQVTIVTDTILVGQFLGPVPMSGVRVASPIVNLLNVLAMLIGVGGSTLVAVSMGRRDPAATNRAFTFSIALCIILGGAFALVVAPLSGVIAEAISSAPENVEYTARFLCIVCAASPVYILASVMAMLLRTDSCIKLSSIVLAVAGLANVGFDLLFMGALGMGIEGAALATDMGMFVAVLISLLYFRLPMRTLRLCRPGGDSGVGVLAFAWTLLKTGASGALRMLFACIALLFLNYIVGNTVGVMGIALLTVCGNIQLLAVALFSGGGQAAAPMEGVLFGERDYSGLALLMRYVLRFIVSIVGVLIVLIWLFPGQIIGAFYTSGDGAANSEWLLRLYAVGFLPLAVNYVFTYYYNTIQQRKLSLAITACENLVLYVPLIWILTNAFGLVGAVSSFVAAEFGTCLVAFLLAESARRKAGYKSILLLPDAPRELVYEATVRASGDAAARIARGVKRALDGRVSAEGVALRAAMAVEEMVANAVSYSQNAGRRVHFDVRVIALPDMVQLLLRDTGAPFDPTSYDAGEQDEYSIGNITALRSVAANINYVFVIGMNQTIIEVRPE